MAEIKIGIDSKKIRNNVYQGKINVEFDADEDTVNLILALIKKECPLFQ